MWWTGNYGIEIQMTKAQANSCTHPGDCERDVRELLQEPKIRRQVNKWDPEQLRKELAEYGAWDDRELTDHEMNTVRMLWIAAGDISEGRD